MELELRRNKTNGLQTLLKTIVQHNQEVGVRKSFNKTYKTQKRKDILKILVNGLKMFFSDDFNNNPKKTWIFS